MSRDTERALTQFFGGRVCLDFANTLDWRTSADPQELIPDFGAFLRWCGLRGTISPSAVEKLTARAKADPSGAAAVMCDVVRLRSEIWSISEALRGGGSANLKVINALLAESPRQPELSRAGEAFVHNLLGNDLREPIWPILWSLSSVLTSADAKRIGCCQAQGCGWFYVDESPNKSRLWCSSEVCGNRERARRAYAKRRSV